MSEKFFYDNFFQAIIELHEQIQLEQWPAMVGPNGKKPCESWTNPKMYSNFYIGVYLKYIYLLKKVEDCYDQIIHVQIRDMVKKFLECLLCRVIKVNFELTYYNLPPLDPGEKSTTKPLDYVFLDDYLIDLKLEPSDLDLPIPRYFREDRSEERIKRNLLLDEKVKQFNGGKLLPEEDRTKNFFVADMTMEEAIKVIQNFEISRQNVKRIQKLTKITKKLDENKGNAGDAIISDEVKKRSYRHLLAIYRVQKMREEELKFLKMKKNFDPTAAILPALNAVGTNPTEAEEKFRKYVPSPEETRKERKAKQLQREKEFVEYNKNLEEQFKEIEQADLKQKMIMERRDWIDKYKSDHKGEPPQLISLYYDSFKIELKEELDDNQKKEKDKIAKDKLKKEQDKKKKGEQGDKIALTMYTGPKGIEMQNIQQYIEEFKALFETPSEFINQKDCFIKNMAYKTVMEKITEAVRIEVDQAISEEIANMRSKFLKGKKDKIKKPPKVKVPAEKLMTGEKNIKNEHIEDLMHEMVEKKVLRKMVPKFLDDLLCDFNYVASTMQVIDESVIDVPLFYTKQLIKENLIYPLGSPFVKSNMGYNVPSVLFHGPPGTGKTHAALAIAYHTDSLFFDISPRILRNYEKADIQRIIASAFRISKNRQPCVIYFDEAEYFFTKAKIKGGGFKKEPKFSSVKKLLNSMKGLITQDMRILVIGCSNKVAFLNNKDCKNFFAKSLYFSLPCYADRLKLWKTKIQEKIKLSTHNKMIEAINAKAKLGPDEAALEFVADSGSLDNSLDYAILAEMSNGYSHESIIEAINYTLSRQRLDRIRLEPLDAKEFITTLSRTAYTYAEDYQSNKEFLSFISGMNDVKEYLKKLAEDMQKNNKK